MAKARKGLIISLLTLIIAIVVTTSSTYAWFAMNTEVNATNMQITAKSDTTFLVIEASPSGGDPVGSKMGNVSNRSLALTASNASVLPVKYKEISNAGVVTWQTAVGTSFENGTKTGDYSDVLAANVSKHVIPYEFYVGLNPVVSQYDATNLVLSKLNVSTVNGDTNSIFFQAVSVLVAIENTSGVWVVDNYASAGRSAATTASAGVEIGDVTVSGTTLKSVVNHDGTPVHVFVYLYINGDDANVTTQNATAENLGKYKVDLAFAVTAGTED